MSGTNMRPARFCKKFSAGRCTWGKDCRYRHQGPERPIATAFGSEAFNGSVNREPESSLISENAPPDSYTQMLRGGVKATFAAGMVPTDIELMETLRPKMRVELVTTALEIPWYQPTRNVWIECETQDHATKVFRALDSKMVRGVKLRCTSRPFLKGDRWTVQITNATESIADGNFIALLPQNIQKPRKVQSGHPSYDPLLSGMDLIKAKIATLTDRAVTGTKMLETNNKLRYCALLEFEGAPNLDMVARNLNGQLMPELGISKLSVSERLHIALSIDRRCYRRHTLALKQLAAQYRLENGVQIRYDEEGESSRPVNVVMRGTSRQQLMGAKAAIEAIFIDEMVSVLQRLQPPPKQPTQTHRIRLVKTMAYRQVLKNGLREAQKIAGSSRIELDEDSDPPAVIVRGDTAMLRKVKEALFSTDQQTNDSMEPTCEVCLDEEAVDEVIVMPNCDHRCCKDCFVSYCTVENEAKFPMRCFEAGCNELLPMQLIRANVEDASLLVIMQQALKDHFDRHPDKYAQCPGVDCAAYYKLREDGDENICPTCFTVVCIRCNTEQHFAETCAQYRERVDDDLQALKVWMREGNAKKCIRCSTIVQKIEGCNNMNCPGCKADFCFSCMEVFPTHADVYRHMAQAHGGHGDEEALALQREVDRVHDEARLDADRVLPIFMQLRDGLDGMDVPDIMEVPPPQPRVPAVPPRRQGEGGWPAPVPVPVRVVPAPRIRWEHVWR